MMCDKCGLPVPNVAELLMPSLEYCSGHLVYLKPWVSLRPMSLEKCFNAVIELEDKARNLIALSKGVRMDLDTVPHTERSANLLRTAQAHLSLAEDALALLKEELSK